MKPEKLNPPGIVKIATNLEEELAQKIQEREEKIVETTLEHARMQGEDLLRAKQHLPKRKFAPWLKSNIRFSRPTAYKYMKISRKWTIICKLGEPTAESAANRIGHIRLEVKRTGERSAGKPPAPFDVAGVGDGFPAGLLRHSQRKRGATDRSSLRGTAPILDPTGMSTGRFCPFMVLVRVLRCPSR